METPKIATGIKAFFSEPSRWTMTIGLILVATSLLFIAFNSMRQYLDFRKNFFDAWPPRSTLAQMKAANPNTPVHSIQGYYVETGLDSLESTQLQFYYETDGTAVSENTFISNVVASTDFDVAPIRAEDFRAKDGGTQIWQIRPKSYGLNAFGVSTETYELDPKSGKRSHVQAGALVYSQIYVDPPLLGPTWFIVHFPTLLWFLASLLTFASAIGVPVLSEWLKAASVK